MTTPQPLPWPPTSGGGVFDFLIAMGLATYLVFLALVTGGLILGLGVPGPIRVRAWDGLVMNPRVWWWMYLLPMMAVTLLAGIGGFVDGTLNVEYLFWSGYQFVLVAFIGVVWAGMASARRDRQKKSGRGIAVSPADGRLWIAVVAAWLPLAFVSERSLVLLALSPDAWATIGFVGSMGSVGVTGWWMNGTRDERAELTDLDQSRLRRILIWVSVLALLLGVGLYPAPWQGALPILFTAGGLLAFLAFASAAVLGWLDATLPTQLRGRYRRWTRTALVLGAAFLLLGVMGYREGVADQLVAVSSWRGDDAATSAISQKIKTWAALPQVDREELAQGEQVYDFNCRQCHMEEKVLVGPPMTEIASLYAGNSAGIVAWAKNPGKKRPDMPQMPSFHHIPSEKLQAVAKYMLLVGAR